jgi:hypothetical protein
MDKVKRPTFFLSSTIYDFRDLRSALKFHLEEQGCKVLASEFNDFAKPLDVHSYEACLQSIHSADYFILLIGNRVGGWYDESNRISITQREYREAYQLQSSGKLKILNFVRSEIWHLRETRRELIAYLESTPLDGNTRNAIANHPNKFADDAEFLCGFINEVARNRETKQAVQGKAKAPTGNWIHVFSRFHEVVDVLNGQTFSSIPVEDMTARRLLRRELRDFVGQCLVKFKADGAVYSPRLSIDRFHAEHPITLEGKHDEFTSVSTKRWDPIATFAIHLLAQSFHPVVLPQVLSMATFLEFEVASNSYRETLVYETLLRLQEEIRRFTYSNTTETLAVIFQHTPRTRLRESSEIDIETNKLAGLLHVLDRWSNIIDLSISVLRHLDGEPFEMPDLRPDSPVQGMQQMIDDERPTDQDIDGFLADWKK